jgi:hypothetical protein
MAGFFVDIACCLALLMHKSLKTGLRKSLAREPFFLYFTVSVLSSTA